MKYYRRRLGKPAGLRTRAGAKKESGSFGGFSGSRTETLPLALLKQLGGHMYYKTVAVIIAVICIGALSMLDLPPVNRFTDYIYSLTVTHASPKAWLETAKIVVQPIRNLRLPRNGRAPQRDDIITEVGGLKKMIAPVNGVLVGPYGARPSANGEGLEMHYGIDVAAEAFSPVYAAFSGRVMQVSRHEIYGTTIYLQHEDEMVTIYGRVTSPLVAAGDEVRAGDEIAKVAPGEDGESHLHFEIWEEKQPVDPETYLNESK